MGIYESLKVTLSERGIGQFSITYDGEYHPLPVDGNGALELLVNYLGDGWVLMATIDHTNDNHGHMKWDFYFRRELNKRVLPLHG